MWPIFDWLFAQDISNVKEMRDSLTKNEKQTILQDGKIEFHNRSNSSNYIYIKHYYNIFDTNLLE